MLRKGLRIALMSCTYAETESKISNEQISIQAEINHKDEKKAESIMRRLF